MRGGAGLWRGVRRVRPRARLSLPVSLSPPYPPFHSLTAFRSVPAVPYWGRYPHRGHRSLPVPLSLPRPPFSPPAPFPTVAAFPSWCRYPPLPPFAICAAFSSVPAFSPGAAMACPPCGSLLDYKTAKFSVTRNRRVGLLHRLLQLSTLGYLLG